MKLLVKVVKIASVFILSVLLLLFAVSLIMQNKVAGILLKSVNNNFSTKISAGSYRLSLIKKFPKASVELKNVIVYSSPDFDRTGFVGINTDTLLKAKSASVDFKTLDMLKGAYTFTRINVRSGNLNLFTDTADHYNYDVTSSKNRSGSADNVTLNFNRINLSDIRFVYNDLRVNLIIKGRFKDGQFKSRFRDNNIDFEGKSETSFESFKLGSFVFTQRIPAHVQVSLTKNDKGIFFSKNILEVENWDFVLTGFIASDNYLDLTVFADNIDISRIINLFPEKQRTVLSDFHPSGNLKFEWKTKGKPTRSLSPHYDISWSVKNARINKSRSPLKVDKLSFNGNYTNGVRNKPETSSLNINDFGMEFGSAGYSGSFSVLNFANPRMEMIFKGKVFPAELVDFMNLENISSPKGSIDLNLKFWGYPGKKDSYRFRDVFDLSSQSEVTFNSVGMTLNKKMVNIHDATGKIIINETTFTDNFRLKMNNQNITFSGRLSNFPGWISGNPVSLTGSADIRASSFRPELFMDKSVKPEEKEKSNPAHSSIKLPEDVFLDIKYSIDTLIYKTFNARKISGDLSIKPGILNFKTMNLSSQKGKISGNGLVVQNHNKSFIGRGSFVLTDVDVNEAFITFRNFGQSFLKAENIAGSLSGNISLILPADSLLNPDIRSVTAEGKYILTNGALINFDPVKALSKFIDLSELENIKFEKLENDFFIKNSIFYVPQMEVKSSAVDLSVNGKHTFDNDYQYHVKMLLSEVLSNKTRNNRKLSDEFGEIEDDGLGRTSVFLKVNGKGEDVKVSYDMQAARNQIKEDLKKEKQNLKTIFNEEYGLYKGDSQKEKKQESRPRFRISWEGSDTTVLEEQPPVEKKESLIKKIFKKK